MSNTKTEKAEKKNKKQQQKITEGHWTKLANNLDYPLQNRGMTKINLHLADKQRTLFTIGGSFYCLSNAMHCMWQNIKSLAACVCLCMCVFLCVCTGVWGRISRKRLEIDTWYQQTTNRKGPMGNRLVTWSMMSRDLERSRSWPQNVWGPLSRKRLEIQPRLQQSTYRKWHVGYQMVTWPMTSRDPKRSRSWPRYL